MELKTRVRVLFVCAAVMIASGIFYFAVEYSTSGRFGMMGVILVIMAINFVVLAQRLRRHGR